MYISMYICKVCLIIIVNNNTNFICWLKAKILCRCLCLDVLVGFVCGELGFMVV